MIWRLAAPRNSRAWQRSMPDYPIPQIPYDHPSLMAGPLMNLISGLPDDYRRAQFDQAKLNMLNQLKNIQLVDPATGQINPQAYAQWAQIVAPLDPRTGFEIANLGQREQELTT